MSRMAGTQMFLVILLALFSTSSAEVLQLSKLMLESEFSVSGLSSGAYMAVQFHVTHSSKINGSAIFAGGPFYCAEGNVVYAENKCMSTTLGGPETEKLIGLTREDWALGFVDNPDVHLKNDRIYLFSGAGDTIVDQKVMHSLEQYYGTFIPSPGNLVADFNVDAEHCLPTVDYGEECETLSSPYIGKCAFDGAGTALQHIFGEEELKKPSGTFVKANLQSFDQTPFFSAAIPASIGEEGYIYTPTACQNGNVKCRLHVSFHGCEQNIELIGPEYATNTGFNAWAEANNIVVLYPYVKVSRTVPYNPKGCWDWWGYSGVYYGTNQGVQMKFVKRIIEQLGISF